MKAKLNPSVTLIKRFSDYALHNIYMAKYYSPEFKGYMPYTCLKCGETSKFYIPKECEKIVIDGKVIQKEYPQKIFCPHCVIGWEPERNTKTKNKNIGIDSFAHSMKNECGSMLAEKDICELPEEIPENPNVLLPIKSFRSPIPIYREYEDLLHAYIDAL